MVGDSPVAPGGFAADPNVVGAVLDGLTEHRHCGVVLAFEGIADFLHF
jgi:hypothetical protein